MANLGQQIHMKKPRKEVESKLKEQINRGEEILRLQIDSDDALESAENEFKLWYDYTKDLIPTLFEEKRIQEDFLQRTRVAVSFIDLESNVKEFKLNVGDYLTKIRSILKRLDLYEEGAVVMTSSSTKVKNINKKKVFVIHGRNQTLTGYMFDFLRAIGLEPIEWNQAIALTGKTTPYIQDIVRTAFGVAQAVIVLISGDDIAKLRDAFIQKDDPDYERRLTRQARPNVLFEAGMAMSGNQDRTILVQIGKLRPFSDIQGLHITNLDNSTEKRQELATKLKNADCDVDIDTNQRWMKVGNFEDTPDSNKPITKPTSIGIPIGRTIKKEKLPLVQARDLKKRIATAIQNNDSTLAHEFLREYEQILEVSTNEWKDNKTIEDLRVEGIIRPMAYYGPSEIMKWTLNAIDRLIVISENLE